jgi:heme-degrading monooxygenase HmoA
MEEEMIPRSLRLPLLVLVSLAVGPAFPAGAADLASSTRPIARMWRGHVRSSQADAYEKYLDDEGIRKLRKIPGNAGAQMFRREEGDTTEFVVISYWKNAADIKNFTGPDWEKVKPLPDDPKYLVPPEATVTHYEVIEDK